MRYLASLPLLLVVLAGPGSAQPIRQWTLGAPTGRLAEEFTIVLRAHEIDDGQVILPIARDKRVLVGDFTRGTTEQVGREGRGPGEYEFPSAVFGIGRDSSLVQDLLNRRWLVFHGARIVRTIAPDDPAMLATQGTLLGADSLGRVLVIRNPPLEGEREVTMSDSSFVLLVSRSTGRADTVARTRRRPLREWQERDATGRIVRSGSAPTITLETEEVAALFGDGWLAVARLSPARVDWRRPDGSWIRGAPLPLPVVRYDDKEKAARRQRLGAPQAPPPGMNIPKPTGTAETLPPWERGQLSLLTLRDGRLMIRRTQSAAFPGVRFLVIGRDATLHGEVVLPDGSEIIGSGRTSLFVTAKDADDIVRVARFTWPPPGSGK